jgi:adenylate cyclase
MTRTRKTTAGVLGAAVTAAALFSCLHLAGALRRLDLVAYDWLFLMRGARGGDQRVVFVDIDGATIRDLGRFPIPRGKYAELIDLLSRPESRARAVGFDIFIVDPSPEAADDAGIGRAARRHGHVYFPGIFPKPFAAGSARLGAAIESRMELVRNAYFVLERDPQLRDRFRADPRGAAKGLAARMGVDPALLDKLTTSLLDDKDVDNARQVVRGASGGDLRAFLRGEFDGDIKGVSPVRLRWMKVHTQAEANASILWEQVYLPARKEDPAASLMEVLAGRGITYGKVVSTSDPALGREQHRMLRARLAGVKGVESSAFGPDLLCAYAAAVPEEYPVLPVLDASRDLVSVQPYLTDGDGKVRTFPLLISQGPRVYPAMGLAMALDLLGASLKECRAEDGKFVIPAGDGRAEIRLPVDGTCRVLIDWGGPWQASFRHVSLSKLLPPAGAEEGARREAERLAESLKDKLVFVGLTAPGTHDLNPTPFQERYPMVGVNGHLAEGVLRGTFPRESRAVLVVILIAAGALAGAFAGGAMGRLLSPFVAAAAEVAAFLGAFGGFVGGGLFVPPVPVMGALGLAYVGGLFWRYLVTEREGRRVRQIFAARTSPALVEEMMRNPDAVRLGGKRVEATVFFADLSGFTTVAEATDPRDLIHVLNAYLTEISSAVIEAGGYLDKYEGDAVMAVMGVPVERPDHAAAACRAALDAQARLVALRARLESEGGPLFRCRIGLASGVIVAGNIGSEARSDYTALGDNVNLASRLEGANKIYGTRILVSEKTAGEAGAAFVFREVDRIRVKGRRGASRVLELVGREAELDGDRREALGTFARALELYRERRFAEASDLFMEANAGLGGGDGPCETLIGRCQRYMLKPPPDGWDGVYEMTGK